MPNIYPHKNKSNKWSVVFGFLHQLRADKEENTLFDSFIFLLQVSMSKRLNFMKEGRGEKKRGFVFKSSMNFQEHIMSNITKVCTATEALQLAGEFFFALILQACNEHILLQFMWFIIACSIPLFAAAYETPTPLATVIKFSIKISVCNKLNSLKKRVIKQGCRLVMILSL